MRNLVIGGGGYSVNVPDDLNCVVDFYRLQYGKSVNNRLELDLLFLLLLRRLIAKNSPYRISSTGDLSHNPYYFLSVPHNICRKMLRSGTKICLKWQHANCKEMVKNSPFVSFYVAKS